MGGGGSRVGGGSVAYLLRPVNAQRRRDDKERWPGAKGGEQGDRLDRLAQTLARDTASESREGVL